MTDSVDENIFSEDPELKICFQWMKEKKYDQAQIKIEEKMKFAQAHADKNSEGILLSMLGMLYKLKLDVKTSYKYYQLAEKCLPDDATLAMISARLLVEEFNQCETALRKIDKIILNTTHDPVMQHHALALKALAYFKMGKKPKAKEALQSLIEYDFSLLRSSSNVDYKTCESFLAKGFEVGLCLQYLEKCLQLAIQLKEKTMQKVLSRLIDIFSKPRF